MKFKYSYWDNSETWHGRLLFTVISDSKLAADQAFKEHTGLDLKKNSTSCTYTRETQRKTVRRRQEYLSERGIEILNCMVQAWEENDAPLPGDISYAEVFEWLGKLKADQPMKLVQKCIGDNFESIR